MTRFRARLILMCNHYCLRHLTPKRCHMGDEFSSDYWECEKCRAEADGRRARRLITALRTMKGQR